MSPFASHLPIRSASKIFGANFVNIAGSIISTYYGGPWGAAAWRYEFNRAMGAPSGQAFKSAVVAGVSAWAFSYISNSGWSPGYKAFAAGMVGGINSSLQGGKFGNGFISAGFTQYGNTYWAANFAGTPAVNAIARSMRNLGTSTNSVLICNEKVGGCPFLPSAERSSGQYSYHFGWQVHEGITTPEF